MATVHDHTVSLVRRSWWMLAVFVLAFVVTTALGVWFLHLLGLHKGDLPLMAHNAGGWAAELTMTSILAAGPVAGLALAGVALRRGAARTAWIPLVLNALALAVTLYMFADSIRMSYFPGD